MKLYKILFAGLGFLATFASCELKDEIKGGTNSTDKMGMLAVDLALQSATANITKADGLEQSFPVEIYAGDAAYLIFATYKDLKEEAVANGGAIALPEGTYRIVAHTAGELPAQSAEAYYSGQEIVDIVQGVTSNVNISCKMQNIKFQLYYTAEFLTKFSSWSVIIAGGDADGLIKVFDETQTDPAPFFFKPIANMSVMTLTIQATHAVSGNSISKTYTIDKSQAQNKDEVDSPYFTANDFIKVTLNPGEDPTVEEPDAPSGAAFDVKVDLGWEDRDDTIQIPVEEEDTSVTDPDPVVPGEGMPSLSCEYFDTPVTYSMEKEDWPASADVIMDVPNGIKSVIVTITGGNSGFASVMEEMSFDKGLELVGNQMINELFGGLGLSVGSPSTNDTYDIATT